MTNRLFASTSADVPPPPLAARYSALILAGPTAVGKSSLAIEAAEALGAEIVGADAFQVYRGLDILTAKPTPDELQRVPHHLIGEVPLQTSFDVAQYLTLVESHLADIRRRGRLPLIVGGTGLYIRALLRGLAPLPPTDLRLREELSTLPLPELQHRLTALDPVAATQIDLANPRRVIRALEVCLASGRPFSSFREEWDAPVDRLYGVFLTRPRADLYARIDQRVDQMFAEGVIEEVAALRDHEFSPTSSQTLGLSEIRQHLAGSLTRAECIASIQKSTRHYAKRQLTWFKREQGLQTLEIGPVFSTAALFSTLTAFTHIP